MAGPGSRGLASPDPFLGAFRGVVPQIMEDVEVVQLVPIAGNRSWYASATDLARPLVQLLDKVADLPVASMTGAWGRLCRKLRYCSCCADIGFDDPVVQVVVWVLPGLLLRLVKQGCLIHMLFYVHDY